MDRPAPHSRGYGRHGAISFPSAFVQALPPPMRDLDSLRFGLTRITRADVVQFPGDVAVVSAAEHNRIYFFGP